MVLAVTRVAGVHKEPMNRSTVCVLCRLETRWRFAGAIGNGRTKSTPADPGRPLERQESAHLSLPRTRLRCPQYVDSGRFAQTVVIAHRRGAWVKSVPSGLQSRHRTALSPLSAEYWFARYGDGSASSQERAMDGSQAITEEAARAIGVDAYLYFYPLISMDITRRQSTNIEAGKEFGKGPMNTFVNVPAFPPADLRLVVRVNFDTLYSIAWLDLTKEPQIVSVPDTDGRFYLMPMLDMWTDVFASPGWRTTGTQAANFLLTPPGWSGAVPDGSTRIDAPTPYVWIIGRTKTDGPADYDAVHKVQAGYKVTPLSSPGNPARAVTVTIDPSVDMKTPPKVQADTMPAAKYFAYGAELLKLHPPHITDGPIIAQMKRIGIEPGKSFDFDKLDPAVKRALESAPEEAQKLMQWKIPTLARVVNGWSMNTDTMGVYVISISSARSSPRPALGPTSLRTQSIR
jgi:hypothetical protein